MTDDAPKSDDPPHATQAPLPLDYRPQMPQTRGWLVVPLLSGLLLGLAGGGCFGGFCLAAVNSRTDPALVWILLAVYGVVLVIASLQMVGVCLQARKNGRDHFELGMLIGGVTTLFLLFALTVAANLLR